ncbi:MAG: glycosyltransferase family A protein [Malacoplasma sp.]
MKRSITIFTPTYNRAYILTELYKSLYSQSCLDFEWLIVDDGSTDNTKELVSKWILENKIAIKYIFQNNGGKMRAHNTGVKNCVTELFICVDSDDYIARKSIDNILRFWSNCKNKNELSGIIAYKGKNTTEVIGTCFPKNIQCSSLSDLYSQSFKGDTSLIFKTNILKQYLFPEIKNEKFITEAYIYDQIDQKYKFKILKKIIIVCSYLNDGYTKNGLSLLRDNPQGWALYYNQKVTFTKNLKDKLYFASQYVCYAKIAQNKKIIDRSSNKVICFFAYILGIYLVYKRRKQFKDV